MRPALGVALCMILACSRAGIADAQPSVNDDRAALAQCLSNAKKTKAGADTCIGVVQGPCLDAPGGQSTYGMKDCANREAIVWDEELNKAYKAVLSAFGDTDADDDGGKKIKRADLIRDAQRAWVAFRDKKCEVASLQMAGGTGAGVLYDDCYLYETAHQAIWLNSLVDTQ